MINNDFLTLNDNLFSDLSNNVSNCNYYDLPDLSLKFSSSSGLLVLHVNIRSLQKHFDDLHELIAQSNLTPDIIAITETRKIINPSTNVNIPGYRFHHINPLTNAGGVRIYIRDNILSV